MFGLCKTKYSSKDRNRCLFSVSKIGILWYRLRTCEQVKEPFLVLNIYFTFFLSVVDCTFSKSTIKSNCILLLCHVRVRSSHQELFCKKGVLRNFARRLCTGVFLWILRRFWELPFLRNTSGGCFWRFRVNLHSIVLELLARNRRNIWSLCEKKLHGNITVQT